MVKSLVEVYFNWFYHPQNLTHLWTCSNWSTNTCRLSNNYSILYGKTNLGFYKSSLVFPKQFPISIVRNLLNSKVICNHYLLHPALNPTLLPVFPSLQPYQKLKFFVPSIFLHPSDSFGFRSFLLGPWWITSIIPPTFCTIILSPFAWATSF